MTTTERRLRIDATVAVAVAARRTGWRVCPACGELSIPPGRVKDCIACVAFVPVARPTVRSIPVAKKSPKAPEPTQVPPADFGWERTLQFGNPSFADRVVWTHPQTAVGSAHVYANKNGVGVSGQHFYGPHLHSEFLLVIGLAAAVSRQLAAGVKLADLDFKESEPETRHEEKGRT